MYFEIWDVETRNLLADFDTLEEALAAARELASWSNTDQRANLALARVDDEHRPTWLARGDALLQMLAQRPAV
ncbi:MAG: hypothetical protein AB7P40_01245 [Chloroflexota bacterium]